MRRLKRLVWQARELTRAARLVGWRVALLNAVVEQVKPVYAVFGVATPTPIVCTRIAGVSHPVSLRLGTTDIRVLQQIFEEREYSALDGLALRTIIDCGAYAGFSALYFVNRFPGVRIVAVEPDPDNSAVFRTNLAPYSDQVTLVEAAVWSDSAALSVVPGEYKGAWASYVRRPAAGDQLTVRGIGIPALIALCGSDSVDLLKVDIERSELAVFGSGAKLWLPRIRNIAIELHGEDCADAFFSSLADCVYDQMSSGELTLCLHIERKRVSSPQLGSYIAST